MPTQAEVEALILKLLAKELGTDPETLHEELVAKGADMPFSSVVLVEFVTELEKRYGVRVPHTTAAASALGSVFTFAHLIMTLAADDTAA